MAEPDTARLEKFFQPRVALLFVLVFGAFITWRWSMSRVCDATWATLSSDEIERQAIVVYLERLYLFERMGPIASDDVRVLAVRAANPNCCTWTIWDPPFLLAPVVKSQYQITLTIRSPPPERARPRDYMTITLDACGRRLDAGGPDS